MIEKIMIKNYRAYQDFTLEFNDGMNIIVGDNDIGKSTLLEAVNLALTSKLNGRPLAYELSPYLFNTVATEEYLAKLIAGEKPTPPEIIIDLFLKDNGETGLLKGSNNLTGNDAVGVRIKASMSSDYSAEYENFITEPAKIKLVPAEYYNVEWLGFSGNGITMKSLPSSPSFIDASAIKLQSGADYHLQAIIKEHLDPKERVELSRTYRNTREEFADHDSVKAINVKLGGSQGDVSDRSLSLAIDISQRYTWESSLVAHLDGMPFQYVGNGEQNTLKILLALNRRAEDSNIILIEEPENHLSFSTLNMLVTKIATKCVDKQVLISTHSSYVLNKLGMDSLILLTRTTGVRIGQVPNDTQDYFMKLSGYDTLRLVLAKKVILVEGPSDELMVQRAYMDQHSGKLPIDDGIDVINVRGLSFKRFLDIAKLLKKPSRVVTDNDGKADGTVEATYSEYTTEPVIKIHVGKNPLYKTLEPQILHSSNRETLNRILGTTHATDDLLVEYMKNKNNKTTVALKIFESTETITMPEYILDAIA